MTIDSSTITASLFLFFITASFISFVFVKLNPPYLQKNDKKVNTLKAIGIGVAISLVFTSTITYISVKVDQQILLFSKKSSPL